MSKGLQEEQQFVTAVFPWVYVVAGLFLFPLYGRLALLIIPLCLLLLNPAFLLRVGVLSTWKRKHVYLFNIGMWLTSLVLVVYTGSYESYIYPVMFFIPIGYAALFFSRRWLVTVVLFSLIAVIAVFLLAGRSFVETPFATPFVYGEITLFAFVILLLRLLHKWTRDAKQYRPLSLTEEDRNNPRNQLRLNVLFGCVYLLLHVIQWLAVKISEMALLLFGVVTLVGFVVWIVVSYSFYEQPGRALQPFNVLLLSALCTASVAFSGFAHSLLFPGLYLLPVMFMSFNTSRKIGMGTGLLSFVLALLVLWATPETKTAYVSRLFVYGFLFYFLPQMIGHTIRAQMHLLKRRSSGQKAERYV